MREAYDPLSEDHPADERTYRRDLENLEYLGCLRLEDGRYWAVQLPKSGRALALDLRELFALYVAKNMLAPLRETPFYAELERVFSKVENVLGPRAEAHLASLAAEIHFEPGPRWGLGIAPDVLVAVENACAESHVLEVTYASVSGGDERVRELGPHFLYFAQGSLYLVAEDLSDRVVKVFALARMSRPAMLEREYSGERSDPPKFFQSALSVFRGKKVERIELTFRPPYATVVKERRWHSTQQCKDGPARTTLMTLDVAITPELVKWVLGFGDGARVEKPEALVKQVVAAARATVDLYKVG